MNLYNWRTKGHFSRVGVFSRALCGRNAGINMRCALPQPMAEFCDSAEVSANGVEDGVSMVGLLRSGRGWHHDGPALAHYSVSIPLARIGGGDVLTPALR